jgi:4-amino-4-deoxychorismate lyase
VEGSLRSSLPEGLTLIETFGRRAGRFVRLTDHLARLERTARALGVRFDRAAIDDELSGVTGDGTLRVRLTLSLQGVATAQGTPLAPGPRIWSVAIYPEPIDPADPWLQIKTSCRARYDRARAALPTDVDEWLFLNSRGEVCEGTITNLFLRRDGRLLTPSADCGLLPGVLRAKLLKEGATEAVLRMEDLERGELLVGNSLRGLARAQLVS